MENKRNLRDDFVAVCENLGIGELHAEIILNAYENMMEEFKIILEQEKNSLYLTYLIFFDDSGELYNNRVKTAIELLISSKKPVLQHIIDNKSKINDDDFDTLLKEISFSTNGNPFQWGLNFEKIASEYEKNIHELLYSAFRINDTYKIETVLNAADEYFKYLSQVNRLNYCFDYVQKKLPKADLRDFVAFIDTFEEQLIYCIKNELKPKSKPLETSSAPLSHSEPYRAEAVRKRTIINKRAFKEILNRNFKDIVGLDNIKQEIEKIVSMNMYIPAETSINILLTGNPGTGKSTIAQVIANILYECGVTTKPSLKKLTAADLQGQYVGHTIPKIQELFKKSRGGVILLDEIYSLATNTAFTQDAVNELLVQLESKENQGTVVIAAGYEDKINNFFRANPGLRSRFSKVIKLENYSLEQLMKIAELNITGKGFNISSEARELFNHHLSGALHNPEFGNARYVKKAVEEIEQNTVLRVWEYSDIEPCIEVIDVEKFIGDKKKAECKERKIGF